MNINQILEEICKPNSIYDEIIENILYPNLHLKGELVSEIAIGFISNQIKVIEAYNKGYFKYYFINTVKNQVHSKTSSFYKITKSSITQDFNDEIYNTITDDDLIQEKRDMEQKYILLNEALENTNLKWFEIQMFNEYYGEGKTYRQIEKDTGVDHCLVFHNVKNAKTKIINYIEKKTNYTK